MFTVIICDESVIKDCTNKYKIHFKPFLDSKDYAFCAWNPSGKTLKEAVSDLESVISIRKEWRAVVLADSHSGVLDFNKVNPFDYADYMKIDKKIDARDESPEHRDFVKAYISEYRSYVKGSVDKAMSNPLMKLSVWLAGSAVKLRPSAPDSDFLSAQPCGEEYEKVRTELGCSVSDLEISLARAYRFDKISETFELGGELFNAPKSIIAIAERSIDTELLKASSAWKKHTEFDYSNFIEDNMYSNKLRCLLYELPRVKGLMKENDYFNYLSTVMVIAANEIQSDILKFGRVYEVHPVIDEVRMGELCNNYLAKLKLTLKKLSNLEYLYHVESKKEISDSQAEKEFEQEIPVSVNLPVEFEKKTLMCEFDQIGLSKDCPSDEESYWRTQHKGIRKRFNRFLRQPQRSVEKAVDAEFRRIVTIDAEKAKRLTKYQRQDVLIKLYEEEQNMIETQTSSIFDKASYDRILNEADKNILNGISHRMTKRRNIIAAVIPLVLFVLGFIPLFISELNNIGTASMSLLLMSIAFSVVAVVALIMMFVFRHRLINRFKGFNYAMSGVYNSILGSMGQFSEYLSHAGNVMREFAVLNACEDKYSNPVRIYKKHEIDIKRNISTILTLFSDYIDEDYVVGDGIEPFRYNFDNPVTYGYEFPYHQEWKAINYLQTGNIITVPIDYLKAIELRREELYD